MFWPSWATSSLLIYSSGISPFFVNLLLIGHSLPSIRYVVLSYASAEWPVGARWLTKLLVVHSDLINSIILTATAYSTSFHLTEDQLAKLAVTNLITRFVSPKGTL